MRAKTTGTRRALMAAGAAVLLGAGFAAPSLAQAQEIMIAPPPPRWEAVPPAQPGMAWIKGHWRWDGRGYAWEPGHWAPVREGRWVEGHWARGPGGWVWVEGRWAR
jgi:hypothetical protein